jgi:hypothetical protein
MSGMRPPLTLSTAGHAIVFALLVLLVAEPPPPEPRQGRYRSRLGPVFVTTTGRPKPTGPFDRCRVAAAGDCLVREEGPRVRIRLPPAPSQERTEARADSEHARGGRRRWRRAAWRAGGGTLRLTNELDQRFMETVLPDGARGNLAALSSLGAQEAVICGEGVPLPMRIRFDDLPSGRRPRSDGADFTNAWQTDSVEMLTRVLQSLSSFATPHTLEQSRACRLVRDESRTR